MEDQYRSRALDRKYQATVEEDPEDDFFAAANNRTMRQEDNVPRSRSQTMPASVPRQEAVHQDAVIDGEDATEVGDADPEYIIGYWPKSQQQQGNVPSPVVAGGRTLRFRGSFMPNIGKVFPYADVYIHRVGAPLETDFEVKGSILFGMRSAFDPQAIYRVTLTKCDAGVEHGIIWNLQNSTDQGYTADEYCNMLELGESHFRRMMMFTIHERGLRYWKIIRQIPGKVYTFQDCVDMLGVPDWYRHELREFGNSAWIDVVPKLWIRKDLGLKNVSNKIKNIMRQ
ncbi:hypothetical protein N0V93_008519 [Gnomoniopsis smithogilvyi]|uniref:Uncharacterized protein n=1 Tax=Gnomoniopsis smithogilvyi TaxID=1191159 RepID=A0A9W9CTZ7_9PEZI|nr:hypothetical protein N0V93_008519 [Gnomoniopsis smithogilvyi]